jgi:hypothetical protein
MKLMRPPTDLVRQLALYLFRPILYIRQRRLARPSEPAPPDKELPLAYEYVQDTLTCIAENESLERMASMEQQEVLSSFDRWRHVAITFSVVPRDNVLTTPVSMRGGRQPARRRTR